MRYNPSLDGLRAIAVAAVVTAHAGLPSYGGYHGVTVFFVISGYLITTLLVNELTETGELRLLSFYRRRFARLGPALVLACGLTVAYLLVTGMPVSTWGAGLLTALTYSTDFVESFVSGARLGPFEPTWTLSIEEQFYLVWPAVLLLCWRGRQPLILLRLGCAALLILSWLDRARFEAGTPSHGRLFYAFDTHADALLMGCLLAASVTRVDAIGRGSRWAAALVGSLGVIALVMIYFGLDDWPSPSFDLNRYGQVALASGAVVTWLVVSPSGLLGRVLSASPLTYLGRLSYGIYLYNLLLAEIFERVVGSAPLRSGSGPVYVLALVGVSAGSYRWVETPLRRAWSGRVLTAGSPLAIPSGR